MKNFTKPQLIKSLALPAVTLVYSIGLFAGEISSFCASVSAFDIVRASVLLLAALACGVLPVLLTVLRNIHTERYFFKRLCTFVVCFAAIKLLVNHIPFGIFGSLCHIVIVGGKVVYELLKVQDNETTNGERAVMFFSDIIVLDGIDYILVMFRDLGTMTFL